METESLLKGSIFVIAASLAGLLLFMDHSPAVASGAGAYAAATICYENEARQVADSGRNLDSFLGYRQKDKDVAAQDWGMKNFIEANAADMGSLSQQEKYSLNNFAVYGTPSTRGLLADQRWELIRRYHRRYGRYPVKDDDWLWLLAGFKKSVYNDL